jgi:signal transduction histidine kinase
MALYALALLLKLPCSLSVVAIALRSAFAESNAAIQEREISVENLEGAMAELREKDDSLKRKADQLREALVNAQAAEQEATKAANAERIRHSAYQKYGRAVMEKTTLSEALHNILNNTLDLLKARGGAFYLCVPADIPSTPFAVLAALQGVKAGCLPAGVRLSPDQAIAPDESESVALCQALSAHFPEDAKIVGLTLSQPEGRSMGWIVADVPERGPDFEVLKQTIDDSLDRVSIGIELILSREIIGFNDSLRSILREMKPLKVQLDLLSKLAAEAVGATRATIEVSDDHFGVTQCGAWPAPPKALLANDNGRTPSPYPQRPSTDWIEEGSQIEGVLVRPLAMARVPMEGSQQKRIGVIKCLDKRLFLAGNEPAPFNCYDVEKLTAIAEMTAGVVERAFRQRSIEMLVARSVHELRNPVARIRNIIRWLRRQSPSEHLDIKLRDAGGDIEVLRRLVDQVDIYRGAVTDEKIPTRIFSDIIYKETVLLPSRLHELGIPKSNITIETLSISIIPTMIINRSTVQQIISNLVENAVKYRGDNGSHFKLTFIGDLDANFYKIRVQDWGIGIPEGWDERIFVDGERAPNALRRSVTGMGMGLFIAREMARKMNGDLKLLRRADPTEFVFEMPKGLRQ